LALGALAQPCKTASTSATEPKRAVRVDREKIVAKGFDEVE
jgi:hypothetical protein